MGKVKKPNDPCVHCQTKVKKKICPFKLSKLEKTYFYTHTLHCEGCGAIYNMETYKITKADIIKKLGL